MSPTPRLRLPGDRTVGDDDRSMIAVFADCETAHAAVERLVADGVPADRISIIGKDVQSEDRVNGFITTRDLTGASAAAGAWVGGLLGLLTGTALLFLPGVGPFVVLGPLAAGAINAAEGALVGSGVGAVLGHFVHKRDLPRYEQRVRDGSYLVVVHGTEGDVTRAQRVLTEAGGRDVERHDTYRGPTTGSDLSTKHGKMHVVETDREDIRKVRTERVRRRPTRRAEGDHRRAAVRPVRAPPPRRWRVWRSAYRPVREP